MPDRSLAIVRWVLLASTVINLLQATLLFDTFQRRIFEPWFAMSERRGGHVPAIMRDTRMHRAWPLLMAALFFGLWWFTGTPGGADAFQRVRY